MAGSLAYTRPLRPLQPRYRPQRLLYFNTVWPSSDKPCQFGVFARSAAATHERDIPARRAAHDAPYADAAHISIVIDGGEEYLQRRVRVPPRGDG